MATNAFTSGCSTYEEEGITGRVLLLVRVYHLQIVWTLVYDVE